MTRSGPRNLITDVDGVRVGSAVDERTCSGVTVLTCPGGWVAAVDIRGGAPGEREVSALGLENLVGRVWAIVLAGGSVFGLAAADAVTVMLSSQDEGLRLNPASPAIPVVAAAVLHDLANGGDKSWGLEPPYRRLGFEAFAACDVAFALGATGAGRGARAGLEPGGLGSASAVLEGGVTVGALVAVNAVGSVRTPDGKTFWAWPFEQQEEFGGFRPGTATAAQDPLASSRLAAGDLRPGEATTLVIVAVGALLTAPEAKRVAIMAHDGLARSINPSHTPFDGDIVFCVADGAALDAASGLERHAAIARIGSAAADVVARAVARGVFEAGGSA